MRRLALRSRRGGSLISAEQVQDDRNTDHEGDQADDLRLFKPEQEVSVEAQERDPESAERIKGGVDPEQHAVDRDSAAQPPEQAEHREVVEALVHLGRMPRNAEI